VRAGDVTYASGTATWVREDGTWKLAQWPSIARDG